jgi:hypothetical protein
MSWHLFFDPSSPSGNLICWGGFRDFLVTIDDNVGAEPALTDPWLRSRIQRFAL